MNGKTTTWTDERIADLRRMWGEGMSASQISAHFGTISRNAVLGAVHRFKLGEHVVIKKPDIKRKPTARDVRRLAPAAPKVKPLVGPAAFPKTKIDPVKAAAVKAIENRPPPRNMPAPLLVRLFDLQNNHCRWPVRGEKEHTLFCGHVSAVGCSYCPGHKLLSVGAGTRSERMATMRKVA